MRNFHTKKHPLLDFEEGEYFCQIVLASNNKNKHEEFSSLLRDSGIKLVFSDMKIDVEENGSSFYSNAYLKARAWSEMTGLPALADDSGIAVRSLDWLPGVRSARIVAGSDEKRNTWLLDNLKGKSDRYAQYIAALALCDAKNGWTLASEARCGGQIAEAPRGSNGFGYDPLFIPDGYSKTFGELDREIKLKISHRSFALRNLLYMIKFAIVS